MTALINVARKVGSPVIVLDTAMVDNYLYTLTREVDFAGRAFFAATATNLAGAADIRHQYRERAAAVRGYGLLCRCVR